MGLCLWEFNPKIISPDMQSVFNIGVMIQDLNMRKYILTYIKKVLYGLVCSVADRLSLTRQARVKHTRHTLTCDKLIETRRELEA